MHVAEKVIIVTGGASGIGRALCYRFARQGAKAVSVVDADEEGAKAVADEKGADLGNVEVRRLASSVGKATGMGFVNIWEKLPDYLKVKEKPKEEPKAEQK